MADAASIEDHAKKVQEQVVEISQYLYHLRQMEALAQTARVIRAGMKNRD